MEPPRGPVLPRRLAQAIQSCRMHCCAVLRVIWPPHTARLRAISYKRLARRAAAQASKNFFSSL
jgi:hypothetical protein